MYGPNCVRTVSLSAISKESVESSVHIRQPLLSFVIRVLENIDESTLSVRRLGIMTIDFQCDSRMICEVSPVIDNRETLGYCGRTMLRRLSRNFKTHALTSNKPARKRNKPAGMLFKTRDLLSARTKSKQRIPLVLRGPTRSWKDELWPVVWGLPASPPSLPRRARRLFGLCPFWMGPRVAGHNH